MSASLVGSEMCIRDSPKSAKNRNCFDLPPRDDSASCTDKPHEQTLHPTCKRSGRHSSGAGNPRGCSYALAIRAGRAQALSLA
eukprot:7673228-Alexandrium_andersonii.AAC.1